MAHQYLTAVERVKAHRSACRSEIIFEVCDDFIREGTSPSVRAAIEEATRGRMQNPVWNKMRKGVVMASDFQELRFTGCDADFMTDPILERKTKRKPIAATKWEVAREKEALDKYLEKRVAKTRSSLPTELKRTGIIMSSSHPLIGASPQAIVYTKHNPRPVCVVLVKSSHQDRNRHPKEVEQEVIESASNNKMRLQHDHPWYYEAQATMGVVGVRVCDVVMATNKGIRIKRVVAERSFFARLEHAVHQLVEKEIYPNLFDQADDNISDWSDSDYNSTSESESDEEFMHIK